MSEGPIQPYELLDETPEFPRLPGHVVVSADANAALDALEARMAERMAGQRG